MVQRTLVPRRVGPSATTAKSALAAPPSPLTASAQPPATARPRRPHYLDRPSRTLREEASQSTVPVHSDDWMHVELPRTDYIQAGLVACLVAGLVSSVTLLPAIIFFNWLSLVSVSMWAKGIIFVPVACGLVGAWFCLRRAKNDRIRSRLMDELRN